MDALGHVGGAQGAEFEDGDADAHRSGERSASHLVDADDDLIPLGGECAFDAEVVQSSSGHQLTVIPCGSGTSAKTSLGVETHRTWLSGQLTKNTVPTTFSAGTNGWVSWW